MMSKSKKHTKRKGQRSTKKSVNKHHLLWPRKGWVGKHSQALRCHPYCQKNMKKHILHDRIHRIVQEVPIPSEEECIKALNEIRWRLECEAISLDDTAEQKLNVLISIFGKNPKNQETIAALKLQKEIVADFYAHHKGGL